MSSVCALHQYFVDSVARHASRTAVVEPGRGSISYGELGELSGATAKVLARLRSE